MSVLVCVCAYRGAPFNRPVTEDLIRLEEEEKQLDEQIKSCTKHIHQMCTDHCVQKYPYIIPLLGAACQSTVFTPIFYSLASMSFITLKHQRTRNYVSYYCIFMSKVLHQFPIIS